MSVQKVTALVLAGRREGLIDPLAAAAGLADKCIVPVAGKPMILHVLEALDATPQVGRIVVSINDADVLEGLPQIRAWRDSGKLRIEKARTNLVDSVLCALQMEPFPAIVTTADNTLLTSHSASQFIARAQHADVAVAFARKRSVLAAHPEGQRRFYKFSDDSYSNCNTYWLGSERAQAVAEVFRSGGQFAKHPGRIIEAFGLINLLRFHYGVGTLDAAFARFSQRFGLAMKAIIIEDGAAAIDVDNPRTLAVTEAIMAERLSCADKAA